jgi:SHAQKYF class myb-like DNA-binding protein
VPSRYWTTEEHNAFVKGMERFGANDFKAIAQYVGSRNATQVRIHAQKYFLRNQRQDHDEYAYEELPDPKRQRSDLSDAAAS